MLMGLDGKPLAPSDKKKWEEATRSLLMEIGKFGGIQATVREATIEGKVVGWIPVFYPFEEGKHWREDEAIALTQLFMHFLKASAKTYGLLEEEVPKRPGDGAGNGVPGSEEVRGQDGGSSPDGA